MKQQPKRRSPAKKKPLETFQAEIHQVNDQGVGIDRFQGKELVIAGVLPGEQVSFSIEHAGQYRIVGRLQKVLTRSPERISARCPQARSCQGCSLIHWAPAAQLRFKEDLIRQAATQLEQDQHPEILPIQAASQPFGYRTNAKLVLGRQRGRVLLGLYRRGSHDVVDIGDCPLHHPLINKVATVLRDEITRQNISVYNPAHHQGLLRYISVRVSPQNQRVLVTFVTRERNYREMTYLAKWLCKKVPEVVAVHELVNSSTGNVILNGETFKLLGKTDLLDQVGDIQLHIAPTAFFQVNHEQAGRIYRLVRDWAGLQQDQVALDLYCGIGGIALHLARDAGQVLGIEVVEAAVRSARRNAQLNGLSNCDFRAGDVAELIHDLGGSAPQVAVLNPPRGGCEESVLEALLELAPPTLIYVSCNPQTLFRDLAILVQNGYRAEKLQPFDMFPQTPHVESVVRLVRQSTKKTARGGQKS